MKCLYPAIDIRDGKVVRLVQGQFDAQTTYDQSPIEAARDFAASGATYLHMVDLDGARTGAASQHGLIGEIAQSTPLKVQVGGGIRSQAQARSLIDVGVDRLVIGSLAVKDPQEFEAIIRLVGADRITLGVDCHLDENGLAHVAVQGWQETSSTTAQQLMQRYEGLGIKRVLCTDIAKDGRLQGPNFALYRQLQDQFPQMEFLASGGIQSISDLQTLSADGVFGAIVGKALYEGNINLKEALIHALA